jgi:hypothetical protein
MVSVMQSPLLDSCEILFSLCAAIKRNVFLITIYETIGTRPDDVATHDFLYFLP